MSLTSVLKNIYSFVEILQAANTDAVESWDEQALQNALQWAQYCEQVFIKAKGKAYETELDKQIRMMGKLPLSLGNCELCLEYLQNSMQQLKMVLMQNSYLGDKLYEKLVKSYGCSDDDIEQMLSDCFDLSQSKANLQMASVLKDNIIATDDNCESVSMEVLKAQAQLLYSQVDKTLKTVHNRDKSETYVTDKLETVLKENFGMKVLLYSLLAEESCENTSTSDENLESRHFILQFVKNKISAEGSKDYLQDTPLYLVHKLSAYYHSFFDIYWRYICDWAKMMVPCPDSKFRHTSSSKRKTYEELCCHLATLVNSSSEQHISANVIKHIQAQEKKTWDQKPNVWTQIISDLKL